MGSHVAIEILRNALNCTPLSTLLASGHPTGSVSRDVVWRNDGWEVGSDDIYIVRGSRSD